MVLKMELGVASHVPSVDEADQNHPLPVRYGVPTVPCFAASTLPPVLFAANISSECTPAASQMSTIFTSALGGNTTRPPTATAMPIVTRA